MYVPTHFCGGCYIRVLAPLYLAVSDDSYLMATIQLFIPTGVDRISGASGGVSRQSPFLVRQGEHMEV